MNWFSRHRQEWIAEAVQIFGYINRAHIERKFGISTPQASHDLRAFQAANPGLISYDARARYYTRTVGASYVLRTFWSPDCKYLITVHVTGNQIIAVQDDSGVEWVAAGEQQDVAEMGGPG